MQAPPRLFRSITAGASSWAAFSLLSRGSGKLPSRVGLRFTAMTILPARPQSPYGDSISADTFTAPDHKVHCAFRNRLRRKAVWAIVTPLHQQFLEAVEVYRPFEVPG